MIEEIASILAPWTGYCYDFIRKTSDSGKETLDAKEARIKKILEDNKRKIQPIYNSKGKLIEYDKYGRHLNVKA
ncbi:hypothetical protein DRN69_02840 [Candidatus Pacearchaeota archaeon]|nr:MAG: hypothetical protein DRN69_02840 [Candidatus Pacearchaeota archaeon]